MEENTTIGQLLKKARETKNLSIEDIVQQTKINSNVLRHLENDNLPQLPSKTYVKGFVLSYAKAVGIDQESAKEILELTYSLQDGSSEMTDDRPEVSTEKESRPVKTSKPVNHDAEEIKETLTSIAQSLFNKKIFYSIIALVILGSIVNGLNSFFSQLTSESRSIVENDQSEAMLKSEDEDLFELQATKKLMAKVEEVEAAQEPMVDQLISKLNENLKNEEVKEGAPEPIALKEEVKEDETKDEEAEVVEKPSNKISSNGKFPFKKFYPSPTNMYELVADAPEVSDTNLLPPNIKASILPDKQNVYIVATDENTWISYKVDDDKIKRYVLKKGRHLLIRGDQVLLFMGNFNAAKVFLNNKLVTAQTKTGVKSMIFPEENAKNFELPLFPSVNGIPYSADEYKANMDVEVPTIE